MLLLYEYLAYLPTIIQSRPITLTVAAALISLLAIMLLLSLTLKVKVFTYARIIGIKLIFIIYVSVDFIANLKEFSFLNDLVIRFVS